VAVFFTEVGDVGAARLEDPQTQKSEHCDQGEVVRAFREPGGGEHRFELQVGQPEGWVTPVERSAGGHGRRARTIGRRR